MSSPSKLGALGSVLDSSALLEAELKKEVDATFDRHVQAECARVSALLLEQPGLVQLWPVAKLRGLEGFARPASGAGPGTWWTERGLRVQGTGAQLCQFEPRPPMPAYRQARGLTRLKKK